MVQTSYCTFVASVMNAHNAFQFKELNYNKID